MRAELTVLRQDLARVHCDLSGVPSAASGALRPWPVHPRKIPATNRKHFGSLTEAYRLAQRPPAATDIGSAPSIRVNKRFFLRDLYQALASGGVSVKPKPHENLLIVGGIAVKPRSAGQDVIAAARSIGWSDISAPKR